MAQTPPPTASISCHVPSVPPFLMLPEPYRVPAPCQSGAGDGAVKRWMITTKDMKVSVVPK